MKTYSSIFLGIVLGGLFVTLPCTYVGYVWGKQREPNIDDMYTMCHSLLSEKNPEKRSANLESFRRFYYVTLQSAFFSGDMYGYRYEPERWEDLFSAILESELFFLKRTKPGDEGTLSSLSSHMGAYCRSMPFWDCKSNKKEWLFCNVLGSYFKLYKEIDGEGFKTFVTSNTNNAYVCQALVVLSKIEASKKRPSSEPQ